MILHTEAFSAELSPILPPAPRILIVDGDPDTRDFLKFILLRENYEVITADNAEKALDEVGHTIPDLIVMETQLPGTNGLEICKQVRITPQFAPIPILILSAKADEADRVLGFDLGADDYVAKPFSPRELVCRIRRLLRTQPATARKSEVMSFKGLELDISRHQATANGKPVSLTLTEFKLLAALIERRGRVQTRERLLQDVWEYDKMLNTRTVDTHMLRLRRKLGSTRRYLETVRGVGYRFLEA